MLQLLAQAAQQAAPTAGDALTGGGIVGGVMTAAGALYVIWEKVSRRQTEARKEAAAARKEEIANEEAELKLEVLANEKITAAYEQLMGVRKAARDAEIASIKAEMAADRERLTELESREQKCQSECSALKKENATQAAKIQEMEGTITSLRSEIASLTEKLKANGSLPAGTDHHTPLKG